jgi:tRNA threonylcarbamoyladenosine biosynthesis protein TsaB
VLILALETSSQAGSVALLDRDTVLSERRLPADRRSATTLAPAIAQILTDANRQSAEVRLVAVTIGPGSFTGLRVGVTTAKTFAYAVGAEVLGVDTLEVIAKQSVAAMPREQRSESRIDAVIDAQRKELFLGSFIDDSRELKRLAENRIVSVEQWLAKLCPGTIVTGTGIDRLLDRLPAGVFAADQSVREPRAVSVGRLAWAHYEGGRRNDLWKLAPKYLRASAAEEKARPS